MIAFSVPTKETHESDFDEPFKKHILNHYQEDPSKYETEIANLNRHRQDIRGAGKDITGRNLLYKYYGQLELLTLRFPIDEEQVKVQFVWFDAFTQKSVSQYSIAFEKACVIFNIAATCSTIAASAVKDDPNGLKTAYNYFQASAGLFQVITPD